MKRYRLHDLLRAAALAYAASACESNAVNASGDALQTADTSGDAQITGDSTGGDGDAGPTDVQATDATPNDAVLTDTGLTDTALTDAAADVPGDVPLPDSADIVPPDADKDTGKDAGKPDGSTTNGCTVSTPVLVQGKATGFELCQNGLKHRPDAIACAPYVPDPTKVCGSGGGGFPGGCTTDADCAGTKGGHCDMGFDSPCYCQTSCETDADCGAGMICECGEKFGKCVPSSCTSDHDCGENDLCAYYVSNPGCNFPAFACTTPADTCKVKADCAVDEECTWDQTVNHRYCSKAGCAIGRPFAVEGQWRTAELEPRSDWSANATGIVQGLPHELRKELAQYWQDAARMEHASVASFARLTLELMAVGAPPELLVRSQQAGLDEVHHAAACFGLAQHMGAPAVGPGTFQLDGALRTPSLAELAAAAALEGCVWETVAALEAQVAAAACRLPAVQEALAAIAADEANHAELAWDIVRWAVETGGPEVRAAVVDALDEGERQVATRDCGADLPDGLGVLRGQALRRLRGHALVTVVGPARRRLLGEGGRTESSHDCV